MKTLVSSLLVCLTLTTPVARAQTRPVSTSAAARPVAKPVAKPAARPTATAKPAAPVPAAARPAATRTTTPTRPTTAATPAAKPAATGPHPAPKSATRPTTAPAATPAATTAEPAGSPSTVEFGERASAGELFSKGTTMVNLGLGLGLGYSYYGTLRSTPAMSLSVERGFREGLGPGAIGIGGLVGYKAYHYDYGYSNYKSTWTNLLVSVRGTYHYNLLNQPKLDTYAGISLGVRIQSWKDTFYDNTPGLSGYKGSSTYATSGIFVGARYFLTDNIGAFTELGYDMNYLKLGLTGRF